MNEPIPVDCLALAAEAWANGGGTTRTLGRLDDTSGETAWRVSLATLNGPSRFSQFPGIDRIFVLIDQESVELHSQDGSLHAWKGKPVYFPGDLHVWIGSLTGEAHALNVMTRRGRCRAHVEVISHDVRLEPAKTQFLVSLGGVWKIRGIRLGEAALAPFHALRLDEHAGPLDVVAAETGPHALLASIAIETTTA